jgi:receptor expression-enhancing protein 5/6
MDKIPPNVRAKIPAPVLNHLVAFENQLNQVPQLQFIEEKTKAPKLFLVIGVIFVVFLFLVIDLYNTGELLSNLIGLSYPAFATLSALDSLLDIRGQRFWLTYWVSFALLNTLEFFSPGYYIPLYQLFRTAFIIWLFSPMTRGAELIYEKGLKNLVHKHGSAKSVIDSASDVVSAAVEEAHKKTH